MTEYTPKERLYRALRNDMNIISSISVTDIVLMIIWGNEIIELFPKWKLEIIFYLFLRACLKIQPDLTIGIGLHIWFKKL